MKYNVPKYLYGTHGILPLSQVPLERENPGQQTTDEHSLVTVLFTITVEYSVLK